MRDVLGNNIKLGDIVMWLGHGDELYRVYKFTPQGVSVHHIGRGELRFDGGNANIQRGYVLVVTSLLGDNK